MTVSTRPQTEFGDLARGNGSGAPPRHQEWQEPPPPPRRRIKRFQGRLVWTELKYWTTVLLSKVGLGAVVVNWEAKGVRNAMESTAQRLHTIPLFGWMENFEETYRLDLAHAYAATILVLMWVLSAEAARAWIGLKSPWVGDKIQDKVYRMVVVCVGAALAVVESSMLYMGQLETNWEGTSFVDLGAAVATVGYVLIVVITTWMCVVLGERLREVREEIERYG